MLKNYLKISVRSIVKQKGLSFINIFSLSVGIAFCALIFLFVRDELTFDQFHEKKDRLFLVESIWFDPDGSESGFASNNPAPLGPALLEEIPEARLFEEFLKLFMSGQSEKAYQQLREYGLFAMLFPQTEKFLNRGDEFIHKLLLSAFRNTDTRLAEDKPVTPAFLLAALLWVPVRDLANDHEGNGLSEMDAIHLASDAIISHQIRSTSMPRRFTHMARDMWALQVRLKNIRGKRPLKLLAHKHFRAA